MPAQAARPAAPRPQPYPPRIYSVLNFPPLPMRAAIWIYGVLPVALALAAFVALLWWLAY